MELYCVGICDDEQEEREHLTHLCQEILEAHQIPFQLTPFPSAEETLRQFDFREKPFDLLLLDIQMGGMSGMDLAKELRRQGKATRLLFITGVPDYALEGYQVHPVHYLLKPVDPLELEKILVQDWEEPHLSGTAVFHAGSKLVVLPVEEILYLEYINRALLVHTLRGNFSFPMTMAEAEQEVADKGFARCHKSFSVNIRMVQEVGRFSLILRDGTHLPVGRKFYQAFQTAFVHHINR